MEKKDTPPMSEEEIKAIGEIQIGPSKHEVFLNNHYKKLILALIIAALGGAAVIGYRTYEENRINDASNLMVAAINMPSLIQEPQVSGYTQEPMDEVKSSYQDTPAAQSIALMEALNLMEKNQADKAIPALQAIFNNTAADMSLRSRAALAIANYYTQEGKEEATAAWQSIVTLGDNPYVAFALLNLGDLAQLKGDKEAARTFYTQAEASAPNSSFVRTGEIKLRIQLLDVDAPKPKLTETPSEYEMPVFDANTLEPTVAEPVSEMPLL